MKIRNFRIRFASCRISLHSGIYISDHPLMPETILHPLFCWQDLLDFLLLHQEILHPNQALIPILLSVEDSVLLCCFLNYLTFLKWRQQEVLKSENHLVLSFHWTRSFYVRRTGAIPWWESHWEQKVMSTIYRIYYRSLRIEAEHIQSMVTANQCNVFPLRWTGLKKEIWHR